MTTESAPPESTEMPEWREAIEPYPPLTGISPKADESYSDFLTNMLGLSETNSPPPSSGNLNNLWLLLTGENTQAPNLNASSTLQNGQISWPDSQITQRGLQEL